MIKLLNVAVEYKRDQDVREQNYALALFSERPAKQSEANPDKEEN